jgi:predicted CopG family antitoxin
MPRPRKYPERGITLTAYVSRELYERIVELARSRGLSVSEVVQELLMKGLEGSVAAAADPPDPPEDSLQAALKGLEPLERERVLQFMKGLEDAEARLAKLGPYVKQQARTGRLTLLDMVNQQEVTKLWELVHNLKRTYEKLIKKTVRDPATLNMIGERLLRLMKELGIPA